MQHGGHAPDHLVRFNRTLTIVRSSTQVLMTGSVAGAIAAVLPVLIATLYLLYKHGTKAKSIVVSMVKGEAKTLLSCSPEAFDLAGDTGMFLAISQDAQHMLRAGHSRRPADRAFAALCPELHAQSPEH